MKKKVLYLISILLLIGLLFILTGCGESPSTQQVSRGNMEQATNSNNDNQELSGNITLVSTPFTESNNEAVITLGTETVVIDETGKVLYNIGSGEYSNGYAIANGTITDLKTNKEISKNETGVNNVGVTKSGYILQNTEKEELAGKVYKSQIVDSNGKVVWSHENKNLKPEYFKAVKDDYVIYLTNTFSNQHYTIIDAKTGKETDTGYCCVAGYFEYKIKGDYLLIGITANNDDYSIFNTKTGELNNTKLSHVHKILNDKYVYATPLWGTVGIYDMKGELVKDLTEGEVKDIYYINNKYYVISKTDFYYTMDDSFKYISEPIKIDAIYEEIRPTKYGIYFTIEDTSSSVDTANANNTSANKKNSSKSKSKSQTPVVQYFISENDFKANENVISKATLVNGVIDFPEETGNAAFAEVKNGSGYNLIDLQTAQIKGINK